jgi:uncharacterized delta-60 repeat protein
VRRKLLSHLTSEPSRAVVVAVIVSLVFSAVAIAAAGDLDPTFSGDGKQTTNFSAVSRDEANDVAIQSDGKIVAVGGTDPNDFAVARYNPNGTLDSTFSGDGKQTTDFGGFESANGVAIQADGKIVVVGVSSNNSTTNGAAFVLARYNPDGSLDTSFSGDGKQAIGSDFDAATDVAIQADGRIVAVGTCCGMHGGNQFLIARFRANGSLDPTFTGDGTQTTRFPGNGSDAVDVALGVAVQANGKIVAVGYAGPNSLTSTDFDRDFAVARYNPTGSLDTSFSGDGMQTTDFSEVDQADDVAIQGDGKIVVVGCCTGHFTLVRYNPNGSLDPSFSGDGKRATDFNGSANAVAIQADGKIVAAGDAGGGATGGDFALARYNPNGSLDTGFSGDGKRRTDFGGTEQANAVAIQADDRIVAAGLVRVGEPGPNQIRDFALARYLGG